MSTEINKRYTINTSSLIKMFLYIQYIKVTVTDIYADDIFAAIEKRKAEYNIRARGLYVFIVICHQKSHSLVRVYIFITSSY